MLAFETWNACAQPGFGEVIEQLGKPPADLTSWGPITSIVQIPQPPLRLLDGSCGKIVVAWALGVLDRWHWVYPGVLRAWRALKLADLPLLTDFGDGKREQWA